MMLDNKRSEGNEGQVLCSLKQCRRRPSLPPVAVLWSCWCFVFPMVCRVQRNTVSSHVSYQKVSWSALKERSFSGIWGDSGWDHHAYSILDFRLGTRKCHMDQYHWAFWLLSCSRGAKSNYFSLSNVWALCSCTRDCKVSSNTLSYHRLFFMLKVLVWHLLLQA